MISSEQIAPNSQIDLAELLCRVENDHQLLHDIFDIFNQEFPKTYSTLLDAVAGKDLNQVRVAVHTLKGMLSSMSFLTASASATRLESLARSGSFDGIAEEIDVLAQTSRAAQASLRRICSEVLG
jgi:HPt (histidine-containing phosphotransfer) domain-containing protein